jgi:hypothetical protein
MNVKRLLRTVLKKPVAVSKKVKPELVLTLYQPTIKSIKDSFDSKWIAKESGCWEWQGKLDCYGYGVFKVGDKSYKAHRYSYELYKDSFDKSLHVLHRCDNPRCVNPDHLFLGTNRDNIQDKVNKGRSKITNCRLTNAEKVNILRLLEVKSKKEVAEIFNVHISTVSRLKKEHKIE